jgi:hypothetical protein
MKFFNKKSQDSFTTGFYLLFGLMLAAFFIFGVFFKVKAAVDDSSYHKRFYARDLALLVDSMHASNGDMIISYDVNLPGKMKLDLALEEERVFLTDRSDRPVDQRAQAGFRFGYNQYVDVKPVLIEREITNFAVRNENDTIEFLIPSEDRVLPPKE